MLFPRADLLSVIKANAYGHDAAVCAPLLANAGAQWLGVTGVAEGIAIRTLCPNQNILLMSGIGWDAAGEADEAIIHGLTPVVWEPHHFDLLEAAARRRGLAPESFPVHLEIDTGMSRQGVPAGTSADSAPELLAILRRFHSQSPLKLTGVMTHFSAPEILSSTEGNPQLPTFLFALGEILAQGQRPQWLHAGNSTTLIAGLDREKVIAMAGRAGARAMIRPGLALYGYVDRITRDGEELSDPSDFAASLGLSPVLSWKTRIVSLRTIAAGASAGYDNTFIARKPTTLALLPAGYADGIHRLLSNRGCVLVRGQRAPIAGRVSMDQTILDITEISGVSIGDEAVLLGEQGGASIGAWELADLAGTIPWEVLCGIHPRVPRIAVE